MNILVGVSGGIACYKVVSLVSMLKKDGHEVRVVMTEAAAKLVGPHTFQTISGNPVALSLFDADAPHEVKHISWATWAQAAVLAPATANTIGKLAAGIADNMLTTIFMALACPVTIVPAMNSAMLANPAVQANLETLVARGMKIMQPAAGQLACGVSGPGRLPEPEEIRSFLQNGFFEGAPLAGKTILITAGPTQEPIDPVRSITNRSSGKMGYALAQAARDYGADVILVSGPVALLPPSGVRTVAVRTAQEMYDAVMPLAPTCDIVICAAAVSDYRPVTVSDQKIKKGEEHLTITFEKTKDILAELGKCKDYYLVGFAAETENVEKNAEEKLEKKNLDMIAANDVSASGIGFDTADNEVTLITKGNPKVKISRRPKVEVARQILLEISSHLQRQ